MNAPRKSSPVFEAFSWTAPAADKASAFDQLGAICKARDIAAGVAVILAVLERDELDEACEVDDEPIPKLFSPSELGDLQRLAISSLLLLTQGMDAAIFRANQYADKRAGE